MVIGEGHGIGAAKGQQAPGQAGRFIRKCPSFLARQMDNAEKVPGIGSRNSIGSM